MENLWNSMDEKLDEKWMKNGWQMDKIWMKLDGRMSANGLTWRENGTNWKHMKRDEDLAKINEQKMNYNIYIYRSTTSEFDLKFIHLRDASRK